VRCRALVTSEIANHLYAVVNVNVFEMSMHRGFVGTRQLEARMSNLVSRQKA